MELEKNYPWTQKIPVLEQDFKKWQSKGTQESFTFYSLKHKLISQKLYFNWAVEHYQIPFLENLFFEHNLLKKTEWEKLEPLANWTAELLPVTIWKDTIFIGCVDLNLAKQKSFAFKHQFVLTSKTSLQTLWNLTKELSRLIKTEKQALKISHKSTQTNIDIGNDKFSNITTSKTENSSTKIPITTASVKTEDTFYKSKVTNVILSEQSKEHSLAKNSLNEEKTALLPADSDILKSLKNPTNSTPDKETKKPQLQTTKHTKTDLDKETTNKLQTASYTKTTLAKQATQSQTVKPQPNITLAKRDTKTGGFSKSIENTADTKPNTEFTKTKDITAVATINYSKDNTNYQDLLKYSESIFITSLLLEVREDKIYPLVWSGRINIEQTNTELLSLKNRSLFTVLQNGHAYHGFVVQIPTNKLFLNKIGWTEYPKHLSAIPIKNKQEQLSQIFVGLRTKPLHRDKIETMENKIYQILQPSSVKNQVA